jgi:hypothetical protein
MSASPPDPDASGFLTPRERRVLADIEHELRASDASLDVALTDGVLPLPLWLMWIGRAALILLPLVLFLPLIWWSSIAALAATIFLFRLLWRTRTGHGGGLASPVPWGWPPHRR